MRDFLQDEEGFIEVTTPTLSVHTPGVMHVFYLFIRQIPNPTTMGLRKERERKGGRKRKRENIEVFPDFIRIRSLCEIVFLDEHILVLKHIC